MKKKKTWRKFRHRVITELARVVLGMYCRLTYRVRVEKFKEQGKRPYLILLNHQTAADQFFVGLAFRGPVYYVATEDLFSNGFVSKLLRYAVAPIPIKKQTTDVRAVLTCMRVAKEGGTIALAPEGNRTYSGKTEYIKPSIMALVRKLNLPLAIFRIEGGYGVQPRWSDVVRRGKMRAFVARVVEPAEYVALSDEELCALINEGLYVNEAALTGTFTHKKQAEYLERAMYVCPFCGLSEFESHGDIVHCKKCGCKVQHLPTKELKGVDCEFPFHFVAEWYDYQSEFVKKLDYTAYLDTPMHRDTTQLSEVVVYQNKRLLKKRVGVSLYGNRIVIHREKEWELPFDRVEAVSVLGRNKLNIYFEGKVYQLKSHKRFNALRFVHAYYHYKNVKEGIGNGEFLGL